MFGKPVALVRGNSALTAITECPSYNIFSQNGEDGIVEFLLSTVGSHLDYEPWCVDVGAWDGIHLSNTWNLVQNHGFSGLFIEASEPRYRRLVRNLEGLARAVAAHGRVESSEESESSLAKYLDEYQVPEDFFLLSIDVDSDDVRIWKSLGRRRHRPLIVIVEIDSSIPPGVWKLGSKGSSFDAAVATAYELGYVPVRHTGNLIAVRDDVINFVELGQEFRDSPELLFDTGWLREADSARLPVKYWRKLKGYVSQTWAHHSTH